MLDRKTLLSRVDGATSGIAEKLRAAAHRIRDGHANPADVADELDTHAERLDAMGKNEENVTGEPPTNPSYAPIFPNNPPNAAPSPKAPNAEHPALATAPVTSTNPEAHGFNTPAPGQNPKP